MWLLYREVSTAVIDVVSQWPSVVFTRPASPSVFALRSQIKSVTWSTSLEPRGACGSQYPVIPLRSGSPGAEIVDRALVQVLAPLLLFLHLNVSVNGPTVRVAVCPASRLTSA